MRDIGYGRAVLNLVRVENVVDVAADAFLRGTAIGYPVTIYDELG